MPKMRQRPVTKLYSGVVLRNRVCEKKKKTIDCFLRTAFFHIRRDSGIQHRTIDLLRTSTFQHFARISCYYYQQNSGCLSLVRFHKAEEIIFEQPFPRTQQFSQSLSFERTTTVVTTRRFNPLDHVAGRRSNCGDKSTRSHSSYLA